MQDCLSDLGISDLCVCNNVNFFLLVTGSGKMPVLSKKSKFGIGYYIYSICFPRIQLRNIKGLVFESSPGSRPLSKDLGVEYLRAMLQFTLRIC